MRDAGFESFYTFFLYPDNLGASTIHIPDYFTQNKENLEKVFSILYDDESKFIFGSRIRTIASGKVGYLRISKFEQYFHPNVQPELGDVIIDGGVSANIGSQIKILQSIGAEGKWFGFEPDPVGFCSANDKLKQSSPYDNYRLVPYGLWNKKTKLYLHCCPANG